MSLHIFPGSFSGHSHTKNGSQRLTFEIADESAELIEKIAIFPRDKPVLVLVYEVQEGIDPLKTTQEDKDEMRKKLLARIHVEIKKIEEVTGIDSKIIKKILKTRLQLKGIDKDSLAKLDESELANSIFILQTEMNPAKFNYSEYK